MAVLQFIENLRNYGIKRILTDQDFIISLLIWLSLIISDRVGCLFAIFPCLEVVNTKFIRITTDLSISMTALIITGIAVVVAFSDREFLSQLENLGIYENILFVFKYTLVLAISVSIVGAIVLSYGTNVVGFYVYSFLFIYLILSVISLTQLIVDFGKKKAKYDQNRFDT